MLGLVALIGGFFWWQWGTGAVTPELKTQNSTLPAGRQELKTNEEIFVIGKGEGINSVAKRLKQEGLIKSSLVFRLLAAKEGLTKKIQAGDFRLNQAMTPLEVAQELTHGTLDVWVTIPEGWRAEEIAEVMSSQFRVQSSEFVQEAKKYEGRLFPDTYLVPKEATVEKIVDIFLKNFERKFDQKLRQEAKEQELTVDQVLILASIVEREAKEDKDRPTIAGILIKRWQSSWPLQADATV